MLLIAYAWICAVLTLWSIHVWAYVMQPEPMALRELCEEFVCDLLVGAYTLVAVPAIFVGVVWLGMSGQLPKLWYANRPSTKVGLD